MGNISKWKLYLSLAALILLVVGGLVAGAIFYYKRLPKTFIVFPVAKISEALGFKPENLAYEIKTLVPDKALDVLVNRFNYDKDVFQGLGFKISYQVQGLSLKEFYNNQFTAATNKGWKVLAKNPKGLPATFDVERFTGKTRYWARFSAEEKGNHLESGVQYLIGVPK